MPDASAEVIRLSQALSELLVRAETSLQAVADSAGIRGGRQYLSRQLHRDRGPDKHIVLAIVRHCASLVGEPADELIRSFTGLWNAAQVDHDGSASTRRAQPEPAEPKPLDPALVVPVLELVANGEDAVAAEVIATQYPEPGPVAGQIIAEIGRRIPSGAAGLLAAIVDHKGYDVARKYMEALSQVDMETAARVLADPRLKAPALDTPLDATSTPVSILDMDPADLIGRRRAALVRRGGILRVVTEIVQDAAFEAIPEDDKDTKLHISWARIDRLRRADSEGRYDIRRATELVVEVVRNTEGDAGQILGQLLSALVAESHAELAARVLGEAAKSDADGIGEVLDAMAPHAQVATLMHLAWDDRTAELQTQLPALVTRVRPIVVAQLLLEGERRNSQTIKVNFSQLRSPKQVLAEMVSQDKALTARYISRKTEGFGMFGSDELTPEEVSIVGAVRDLASADVGATGQFLGVMLNQNIWTSSRLIFRLASSTDDNPTLWMAAALLAKSISLDSSMPSLIVRLEREGRTSASSDVLLDHIVEKYPDQGREIVRAMLLADRANTANRLRRLLDAGLLEFAGEILRQIPEWDPTGPWDLAGSALRDGNPKVAAEIIERAQIG